MRESDWSGDAVERHPGLLRDIRGAWGSPLAAARARRGLAALPSAERAALVSLLDEADAHRRRAWRAPLAWLAYVALACALAPVLILLGAPHLLQPRVEKVSQRLEEELARPAVYLPPPTEPPEDEQTVLDPEEVVGPVRPVASAPGGSTGDGLPVPVDQGPAVIGARIDPSVARPSWLSAFAGGGGGAGEDEDGEGGGGIPAGMVYIPAGPFTMGSPAGRGEPHEHPAHTVELSPYAIDRDEVSVRAFQAWCTAHADACGWDLTDAASMMADHPVTGVTWHEARAFCRAYGKDLPTEAQWEKAARWDPDGGRVTTYPWGNGAASCARANFLGCNGMRSAPVGATSGASPSGVRDMAGNAREWVLDYLGAYRPGRQQDPQGPAGGEQRVLRGGSFGGNAEDVRATDRDAAPPDRRSSYNGFRCAVAVEGEPEPDEPGAPAAEAEVTAAGG